MSRASALMLPLVLASAGPARAFDVTLRAEAHLGSFLPSESWRWGERLGSLLDRVGETEGEDANGAFAWGGLATVALIEWLELGVAYRTFEVSTGNAVGGSSLSQSRTTGVDALSGVVRLRYVDDVLFLTLAFQPGYYFVDVEQDGYLADDDLRSQVFGWQLGAGIGVRPLEPVEVGLTVDRAQFDLPAAGAPFVDDGGSGAGFFAGLYVGGRLDL